MDLEGGEMLLGGISQVSPPVSIPVHVVRTSIHSTYSYTCVRVHAYAGILYNKIFFQFLPIEIDS